MILPGDNALNDTFDGGLPTLENIAVAEDFNQWMFDTIIPYCAGNMLEIGSGIGNISQHFLKNNCSIMLSDVSEEYCKLLRNRFSSNTNLLGVERLDLVNNDFMASYRHLFEKFNSLFALNVLEHIENDVQAIQNASSLLKKNGTMIFLVPAHQALYNNFDKNLHHFRRYSKKSLSDVFLKNGIQLDRIFHFNALGIVGWFVSGSIQNNQVIPLRQMKIYDKLIPLAKFCDRVLLNKTGLSLILVGRKVA